MRFRSHHTHGKATSAMPALLTKEEMVAADRHAIDTLGIPALVLMESAGRAVADRAERLYRGGGRSGVLAIAGLGNNGGDAIVAARHLHHRGVPVAGAVAGDPARASADCRKQLEIAHACGVAVEVLAETFQAPPAGTVVIDGLFGTGLTREVTGLSARIIQAL